MPAPCCAWGRPNFGPTAGELGIVYGDDASNAGTDYRRNLLRHEVLPVLETINPRVAETLADAAALADDEHAVLTAALDGAWERVARPFAGAPGDGAWALELTALAGEPPALRALCLRRLVRGVLGDDALLGRRLSRRLTELAAGTAGSRGVSLSAGHEALREYGRLTVRARAGTHACPPAPLRPGTATVFCGRRFGAELLAGASFTAAPAEAWLALPRPECEIVLRHPRRGDRLRPFGMASEVLLSDFFTGARVPRARRAGAVVAEVDGRLAWVCPGRSSEWFRVVSETPYTLHIFPEATEAT